MRFPENVVLEVVAANAPEAGSPAPLPGGVLGIRIILDASTAGRLYRGLPESIHLILRD